MSKKIEFTEEQIQNIIEMYINYIPVTQIANKYHINKQVIYKLLKNNNIELHGEKRKITDKQQECIAELYRNGMCLQQIADSYNVCVDTILKYLRKSNVEIRDISHSVRKYDIDEEFFDEINTQEKAYVVGMLWSDGCNKVDSHTVTLALQSRDKHILDDIKKLLKTDRPLYFYKGKNKNCQDQYALEISNKHISDTLDKLGMHQAKSLILEFPQWLDKDLYSSFLRGLLDGDGSISKRGYRVIIVGTNMLCNSIGKILENQGISYKIYNSQNNEITKYLHISYKYNVKKFLDWIYKDATIYLERKYQRYISKYYSDNDMNNTLINVAS